MTLLFFRSLFAAAILTFTFYAVGEGGSKSPPESQEKMQKQAEAIEAPSKKKKSGKKKFLGESKLQKKIFQRQARRRNAINALKLKGVVGEAENGLLKIRDLTGLSKKDRDKTEKIVNVENNDREKAIQKVAKDNSYNAGQLISYRRQLFEAQVKFDGKKTYFFKNNRWQRR